MLVSFKIPEMELNEQHTEVIVRRIGDEFLLQLGDSTSRILPIEKHEGSYLLQFENELAFEPDMLSFAAVKIIEEADIKNSFIVETKNCITNEVVHSFELNSNKNKGELACKLRALPKACYKVYFTIFNEEDVVVSAPQKTIDKKENNTYLYVSGLLIVGALLIVLVVAKKKKNKPSNSVGLIKVGDFHLDKNGMKLIYKGEIETLSSKEANLLELLFSNVNKTVTREDILQVVWGDDGDYLGRTLDVFISKLRKKLELDANLRIVNIRGVGYRLVQE